MFKQMMGAAIICAAIVPVSARADTPDTQGAPSHEIFAQEALPSVGGMNDPGSVTPQSLNGMTIHIKMTKASMAAMHQTMRAHPGMGCRINKFAPGSTVMVLSCR